MVSRFPCAHTAAAAVGHRPQHRRHLRVAGFVGLHDLLLGDAAQGDQECFLAGGVLVNGASPLVSAAAPLTTVPELVRPVRSQRAGLSSWCFSARSLPARVSRARPAPPAKVEKVGGQLPRQWCIWPARSAPGPRRRRASSPSPRRVLPGGWRVAEQERAAQHLTDLSHHRANRHENQYQRPHRALRTCRLPNCVSFVRASTRCTVALPLKCRPSSAI